MKFCGKDLWSCTEDTVKCKLMLNLNKNLTYDAEFMPILRHALAIKRII